MGEPYHYVRFRWWSRVDLEKASKDLEKFFSVERISLPSDKNEFSMYKDEREELKVTADTLTAFLSAFHVVLSQKTAAPFTSKDVALRKQILEMYPQSRPTPFPWSFSWEPKYELAP